MSTDKNNIKNKLLASINKAKENKNNESTTVEVKNETVISQKVEEIKVEHKPLIINTHKENIAEEIKASPLVEETKEVVVENETKIVEESNEVIDSSNKKIYTIPTYLTEDLKNKISDLAKELDISIPKLIKISEKEFVNNNVKVESKEDTLDFLLEKRKLKKEQENNVEKSTFLVQVYCINEKEKLDILSNKENFGFKTGSDYLRAVVSYIIPILDSKLEDYTSKENK